MIKIILICTFLASITQATIPAQAAPIIKSETNSLEIKIQGDKVEVYLPKVAFEAVTKWNPEFVIFSRTDYSKSILDLFKDMGENKLPMAFIEDLDGNGKNDIVLLGADLKKQYAITLLQREKKWTLLKITEWSMENIKDSVITTTTSGTTTVNETGIPMYVLPALGKQGEKLKEMKKVGIQIETYLGSGEVYEITNNKPVKFSTKKY